MFYFQSVMFIGGVALSISHAIIPIEEAESIKHIVEVNISPNLFLNNFSLDLFYLSLLGIDTLDDILYIRYRSS